MDVIYLIEDEISGLKYLGSKKNWQGENSYWGSPSCKNKNRKKYKLQQDWKNHFKEHKDSFKFNILKHFEKISIKKLLLEEKKLQLEYDVLNRNDFINAGLAGGHGFMGEGEENPVFGKKHRKDSINKMSIKQKENGKKLSKLYKGKTYEERWGDEKAKIARKKLSEHSKNRTGDKNSFFGNNHSEKTIQQIKNKQRGNKPINTKKVYIEGNIYNGLNDAYIATNVKPTTIWYRIHSKNKKFKEYKYI